MSTADDRTRTAPDGGRYPGEQPPGQPGYGQPGFGPPDYDPAHYDPSRHAPGPYHPAHGQPPYQHLPYGQTQYAQQTYAQPAYGHPPYGAAGYAAPASPYGRPTNSLAIVSLLMAFVFPPAALVTGIIARRQIRETQEDGDGLALAGIIVGGIVTALFALLILFWVVALVAVTGDGFAP
jgi:hypothetical protein